MKAAVVTAFRQPLEIVDREIPKPAAGQVLVRLQTCGLCHTDTHAAGGDWPAKPTLPRFPGMRGLGSSSPSAMGSPHLPLGSGSPSPGWARHAAGAAIASTGARRCASSSRTAGIPSAAPSLTQTKLDLAGELGAEHLINAATTDPVAAIHELGGLDVPLVLAASSLVFEQDFASLRRGGRLVCVAIPADGAQMSIPVFET